MGHDPTEAPTFGLRDESLHPAENLIIKSVEWKSEANTSCFVDKDN
jgi:hypothetical protein